MLKFDKLTTLEPIPLNMIQPEKKAKSLKIGSKSPHLSKKFQNLPKKDTRQAKKDSKRLFQVDQLISQTNNSQNFKSTSKEDLLFISQTTSLIENHTKQIYDLQRKNYAAYHQGQVTQPNMQNYKSDTKYYPQDMTRSKSVHASYTHHNKLFDEKASVRSGKSQNHNSNFHRFVEDRRSGRSSLNPHRQNIRRKSGSRSRENSVNRLSNPDFNPYRQSLRNRSKSRDTRPVSRCSQGRPTSRNSRPTSRNSRPTSRNSIYGQPKSRENQLGPNLGGGFLRNSLYASARSYSSSPVRQKIRMQKSNPVISSSSKQFSMTNKNLSKPECIKSMAGRYSNPLNIKINTKYLKDLSTSDKSLETLDLMSKIDQKQTQLLNKMKKADAILQNTLRIYF